MENYNFDEQVTPYTGARFVLVDAEDIFGQNNAQKRSVGAPKVIEPARTWILQSVTDMLIILSLFQVMSVLWPELLLGVAMFRQAHNYVQRISSDAI